MLKTVFAALAVSALLAGGSAFAADQTAPAPAAATAQSATVTPDSTAKTAPAAPHVVKHHAAKASTAPATENSTTSAATKVK